MINKEKLLQLIDANKNISTEDDYQDTVKGQLIIIPRGEGLHVMCLGSKQGHLSAEENDCGTIFKHGKNKSRRHPTTGKRIDGKIKQHKDRTGHNEYTVNFSYPRIQGQNTHTLDAITGEIQPWQYGCKCHNCRLMRNDQIVHKSKN